MYTSHLRSSNASSLPLLPSPPQSPQLLRSVPPARQHLRSRCPGLGPHLRTDLRRGPRLGAGLRRKEPGGGRWAEEVELVCFAFWKDGDVLFQNWCPLPPSKTWCISCIIKLPPLSNKIEGVEERQFDFKAHGSKDNTGLTNQ